MISQEYLKGAFLKEGTFNFKQLLAMSLVCLSVLFTSCADNNLNKLSMKAERDISMKLSFQPYRAWMGWIDSMNGKAGTFYFANLTTQKRVVFLNGLGESIDSIPVTVTPRWQDHLQGFMVYNRDTIVATSEYNNNHVYFFNHEGYVFKDVALPAQFGDTLYEAMGAWAICAPYGDKMFFSAYVASSRYLDDTSISQEESLRRSWNSWKGVPVTMAYEGIRTGNPKVTKVGMHLRERYTPDGHISNASDLSCASDKAYYYSTPNADSIYRFSFEKDYEMDLAVPVKSRFSSTYVAPMKSDPPPRGPAYEDEKMKRYRTKPLYHCMKWDKYRRYVYLTAYHEIPENTPPENAGLHRSWSLLVFDENLNRLAEIPFEKNTYAADDFIIHPQGLLLRKTDHENAQKANFTLFEVLPK